MATAKVRLPLDSGNAGQYLGYEDISIGGFTLLQQRMILADKTLDQTVGVVAKGIQAAYGLGGQDLKDAGRSQIALNWEEMAGTAAVESTLTNFTTGSRGGTALGAATKLAVTAGKILRIESVYCYVKASSTVNNLARFRIRQAPTVLNTSPIIFDAVLALEVTGTIAANAFHGEAFPIPDGLEVAGGQEIAFTWMTGANTCTVGMNITAYEY